MRNLFRLSILAILFMVAFTACKDDEPTANVSIESVGADLGGDVSGDGGSTTQSFQWNNSLSTAEY
ncbi:MAG: hypothetical protein R3321_14890, partial [Nitrososphaeraceae archaeon]|nr:hypothetical protein [Nitrososphaeraceae archaeon]